MSKLEFTCHIESVSEPLTENLEKIVDAVATHDAQVLAQHGIITAGIPSSMALHIDPDQIVLSTSSGTEVELSFFDELVSALVSAGATEFHARLIDPSSGGVLVWRQPGNEGDEIELAGADFLFLGDMKGDLQEMIELAENLGSVHDEMNEQVNLVVVGRNVMAEELSRVVNAQANTKTITEDQFWEYLSDQTM